MSKTRLGVAAAAATVADYSLASGVFAWVGGLIILFCRGEKASWKWAWTILAVLIATPYYYHYHSPKPSFGSVTYVLDHPDIYLRYVFAYLGNPVDSAHAGVTGILLALVFISSCCYLGFRHREMLPRIGPWISLGAFAVFSAAITGEGRLELGIEQALSSRYTTMSLLLLLATIVVALVALQELLAERPQLFRTAAAIVLVAISALVIAGYPTGIEDGEEFPKIANYQQCVRSAQSPSESCLVMGYPPSGQYALEQVQYLRSIHWAGF